jgi:hypothetical protein
MSTRSEKAEQILRKMKSQIAYPARLYQGPPDLDFVVQQTTEAGGKVLKEFNESTLDEVGEFTTLSGITTGLGTV